MIRLKYIVCSICMLVSNVFVAREVNVYRSGLNFNSIKVDDSFRVTHSVFDNPEVGVSYTDYYGNRQHLSIPVSEIDSVLVTESHVPVLHFSFPDYPEKDWVWDKENYIDATLDVEGNGVVDDASGLTVSVKGRGNSSWTWEKKPMRLKFPKKTSLCGFKKAKSYVLLADYIDASKMRNAVGQWLARRIGMPYANHTQPCQVYVNGKYHGLYLLTEKVGINSGSVDIDESTGILFELSQEMDEKYVFGWPYTSTPVMVKDPDFDELYADGLIDCEPQEYFEKWKQDFIKAEKLLNEGKADEAFDIESVVNYIFVMNVVGNDEIGFPKSVYLYKESFADKYKFGPVWDLDVSFNILRGESDNSTIENPIEANPCRRLWMSYLLDEFRNIPKVRETYKLKFNEFYNKIYPEMLEFIDEYASQIEAAAKLDAVRWPEEYVDSWFTRKNGFDRKKELGNFKSWLIKRVEYLKPDSEQGLF